MPPIRSGKKNKDKAVAGGSSLKKSRKPSSSKNPEAKPVALRDLKWKPVSVPSMALAAGPSDSKGSRDEEAETQGLDWDPFADLDEGADDFMGLQEVSGVGIKYEGDDRTGKRIAFYQSDAPVAGSSDETSEIGVNGKSDKGSKSKTSQAANGVNPASGPRSRKEASHTKEKATASASRDEAVPEKSIQEREAVQQASEEEEEFKGFGDDEEHDDDEIAESDEGALSEASADENIPQGVFSILQSQIDGADDEHDSSAFADASFDDSHLPSWPKNVLKRLHPILKHALTEMKFTKPTPVQSASLPKILPASQATTSQNQQSTRLRDVVALAQTGSGKTLAYALPILQKILASRSSIYTEEQRPLQALIVLPTRELALQVNEVFQKIVAASTTANGSDKRWVRVAPVVGGMSEERQWRLLRGRSAGSSAGGGDKDAEIIIATVGRLWELCRSDDYLPTRLASAETLVLDEADRLLETGKFQELSSVLDLLQNPERQTLMFSATLDPTLQVNLSKSRAKVARAMKRSQDQDKMATLMDRVGFKDPQGVELVDLTKTAMLSDSLQEGKIECLDKEKDLYLYYLLLRYPGSTLVFFNSIDSVRRLQPLLSNLQVQCFALHGEMDQKTRLKALDNFKKSIPASQLPNSSKATVLLATDVAARGLDIPSVQHVIHFHLPRSTDTYIHRSGRTARAGKMGLSLILLSPSETQLWTSIQKNLSSSSSSTQRSGDVPDLEVVYSIMGRLKKRINLSKEIDESRHRERKEVADDNWVKKLAAEAEIALDEDEVDPDADFAVGSGGGAHSHKKAKSKAAANVRALQEELKAELQRTLLVRGVKRKFITQGAGLDLGREGGESRGADALRGLVEGTGHETFLGLDRSQAQDDLGRGNNKKKSEQNPLPRKKTKS